MYKVHKERSSDQGQRRKARAMITGDVMLKTRMQRKGRRAYLSLAQVIELEIL